MEILLTVVAGFLLAYANGANDNFKGVATLAGSATTTYRRALTWATITTLLGSCTALFVAQGLLAAFSGKGLVSAELAGMPAFTMSVGLAAGATVLTATRFGWPISTTHALVGGLIGAGLVSSPDGIDTAKLGRGFLLPLLTSPIMALVAAFLLYPVARYLRRTFKVERETCVCIEETTVALPTLAASGAASVAVDPAIATPSVHVSDRTSCQVRYKGKVLGIDAGPTLDYAHFLSAGVVSFARGLNDTPKIAALLLVGEALAPNSALIGVAIAIAIGGLTAARRVARTMATEITEMNPGQGFTANMITGLLVVGASKLGVPVSTTHVSCGSLFGIGAVTGQGHWGMIRNILLAWLVTLPIAAGIGALVASMS
ncbi:MAG: inorganic phosphate transporter [Planctomycetota bacterium]